MFYHRKQANMAYQDGIGERGLTLGNTYFLPQIQFADNDRVVDCGANVGDLFQYFVQNEIQIEYIGFEPSKLEYECLKSNVAPGVTYNMGLWNSSDTLEFFSSSTGADSSLIQPPTYDEIVRVNVNRLDSLISGKIKLLKIEAEGAEPEVLQGCENLLSEIEYISADLGFERGVRQESTLAPVINFLLSRNFELIDVSHVRVVALFRNKIIPARH
ncbi:MAG: FkbM family methyltransferase [Candidatus Cloacimonetes bacterium]|nr:FkbM family methyltransferase [Candidatus Cloacimonadota bacterium]